MVLVLVSFTFYTTLQFLSKLDNQKFSFSSLESFWDKSPSKKLFSSDSSSNYSAHDEDKKMNSCWYQQNYERWQTGVNIFWIF